MESAKPNSVTAMVTATNDSENYLYELLSNVNKSIAFKVIAIGNFESNFEIREVP